MMLPGKAEHRGSTQLASAIACLAHDCHVRHASDGINSIGALGLREQKAQGKAYCAATLFLCVSLPKSRALCICTHICGKSVFDPLQDFTCVRVSVHMRIDRLCECLCMCVCVCMSAACVTVMRASLHAYEHCVCVHKHLHTCTQRWADSLCRSTSSIPSLRSWASYLSCRQPIPWIPCA